MAIKIYRENLKYRTSKDGEWIPLSLTSEVDSGSVLYSHAQSLTPLQQKQAQNNIGVGSLTDIERFDLTFSSSITDIQVMHQNCWAMPKLGLVSIHFAIISRSALIPGSGSDLATVPTKYRPSASCTGGSNSPVRTFALTSVTTTWQPAHYEELYVYVSGGVKLANFIDGGAGKTSVMCHVVYYMDPV